jgi:hypothetical protein
VGARHPVRPDVDGRRFRLVLDDSSAVCAVQGQYHAGDDLVRVEFYAGGTLAQRPAGRAAPADGTLRDILPADRDRELVTGECTSVPELDTRGMVRIAGATTGPPA